ncbi:MAG: ABC transporter substrate-binding protein [Thiogranum sp.]
MACSIRKLKVLLALLLGIVLVAPSASAYFSEPGYVPLRRSLPSAIDLMETSLYWMQDMAGVDDPRDPAAIIALMEDQAARFFDFAYMAYLVAGPQYSRLNVLDRSHFQNRIRDRVFSMLAKRMGMLDVRMPSFRPVIPRRKGSYTVVAGGEFYHRGGPHIRLLFHFYRSSKGWRIYDVSSNGVSAVAELRRHYSAHRFNR